MSDKPSLGDCALAPFIGMLQQTIFPFFEEIPDPTTGNGRLAEWWQALQGRKGVGERLGVKPLPEDPPVEDPAADRAEPRA